MKKGEKTQIFFKQKLIQNQQGIQRFIFFYFF